MSLENINLDFYDYNLPQEFIAQEPNEDRDKSKLLIAVGKTGELKHEIFASIYKYLPENSLLIMNSTKVIPARFFMKKQTGGQIELLCISPIFPDTDPQVALAATERCIWECVLGGRNVVEGMQLELINKENININFTANILKRYENKAHVEFVWTTTTTNNNNNNALSNHINKKSTFGEIINLIGKTPLPPYIRRQADIKDTSAYQTVYAEIEGSVAAPTAGLHFTKNIFTKINQKNIKIENVILHIGPGTFVPIESSIQEHKMHYEQIFVTKKKLEHLVREYSKPDKFIVATGTTSLRTLETLYWLGIKYLQNEFNYVNNTVFLEQEYAYVNQHNTNIKKKNELKAVFEALLEAFEKYKINILECRTQLFIHPPYEVRTADALITNFHLPKSTLLLLVASFIGSENLINMYQVALKNNYKFLSYGDSSLLFNRKINANKYFKL